MKDMNHKMGKDGEDSYIELYFMKDSLELIKNEFDDYDSAHEVFNVSYEMMDKIIEIYSFHKAMREQSQ